MKPFRSYAIALCLILLSSCEKEERSGMPASSGILFRTDSGTRAMTATVSSNLTGFSVTGVSSSSTYFQNMQTVPDGPGLERVPDYYWKGSALTFYAVYPYMNITKDDSWFSNKGYYIQPATSSSKLSGAEDIVVAKTGSISNGTTPVPLEFSHILACLDGITYSGESDDATYSGITATLSFPRYGNYSLTNSSWSGTGSAESRTLTAPAAFTGKGPVAVSEGLSMIPSTATLTVSYTVSKNGISASTSKKASVKFTAGKRSTVKVSLSARTGDMEITTTLSDWGTGFTDVSVDVGADVFSVNPSEVYSPGSGTSVTVTVSGAGSWTVSSLPDWITVSAASGTGSGTFTLTVKKNTSMESREGYVVITDGKYVRRIHVIQDCAYDAGVSILPLDDNGSYGETL